MQMFTFHDLRDVAPNQLAIKAFAIDAISEEDCLCTSVTGPAIAGFPTQWWRWRIRDGVAAAIAPSVLDEDDDDDVPYSVRWGLVAFVFGSTTGYVVCPGQEGNTEQSKLQSLVARLANHSFFSPF